MIAFKVAVILSSPISVRGIISESVSCFNNINYDFTKFAIIPVH